MVRPTDDARQLPIAEVKPDTWGKRHSEHSSKDDTVTLTKSQFQQILEAIGQTTAVNGSDSSQRAEDPASNKYTSENGAQSSSTRIDNPNDVPKSSENIDALQVPCPLDVVVSCPVSLSWSASETELSPSKLSPLSKVEQKRLQWERERAEMIEWNPWGKPGAGAPTRKTQIVAPITPQTNNQLLMVQTSAAMPYTCTVPVGNPNCIPSPGANSARMIPNALEQPSNFLTNKNFSNYCIAQPVKPVPPMFKSSINFGNSENEPSSEYFKRQQWLHDLGYQREEQNKRYQDTLHLLPPPEQGWVNSFKDDTESISVSIDGSVQPGSVEFHKRNHVRGQGFQLDPVSAALAEERRLKAQEYQKAIRMQMEEKQRRLEEEKERKKREEEAEERRLEAERARIQAEYEEEQLRLKQKAEMEEKKHQALITAVQQAQAQAELEKKSRKIQKLLPASASLEISSSKKSDERIDCPLSNSLDSKLKIENVLEESTKIQTKSPSKQNEIAESELPKEENKSSEKKELGVQTVPVSDAKSSVYVVDRVLTPSIFRVRVRTGKGRDFGTQTDIHYGKFAAEDAESTESNTSSFYSPVGKRIVRVQHSKPYKAQRRPQCNESLQSGDRPKWGANQPSKSYIRMTERDPHFTKRKKLQELRKQHWARELAAQKASQLSRRSTVTSYPSLRGRRAVSSSDCTFGYSSSEFETRSYRHIRSNSTPRYQQPSGFKSDCGSAETVAFFNYSPSAHHSRVARSILQRRDSQSSDNLPSIIGGSEPSPTRRISSFPIPSCGSGSLPPMRRKWHSQEIFYPSNSYHFSPPRVPGVHPRVLGDSFHYELPPALAPQRRKWSDQESFDLESVVRSRVAEGSRASSAESSEKSESASSSVSSKGKSLNQNPLVCPEVVTGRPTPRQDRILQNLSSLRQGLMKKQKELETLIRRPPPYFS